jgi:peptidoglycan/LPS O-acetylase OafA/YrhL
MIQRIQSIWLLLAAIFATLTFRFPFYSGEMMTNNTANTTAVPTIPGSVLTDLDATTTIWLTILTVLTGGLAFATIFLFRNRRTQLKFTILGIFLSLVLLVGYFFAMTNFSRGNIALTCIFHFAVLICYILAARGIRSDEKLLKSLDRLR